MENENRFLKINYGVIGYASKFHNEIINAYKVSKLVGDNTVKKINNCKKAREERKKYTINDIFRNCWESFEEKYGDTITRQSIFDNVYSMIKCGSYDDDNGYLFFECPNPECNSFHIQPFTCKCRCCNKCGKVYSEARAIEISKKCLKVPHRHITFTIAKELRPFFDIDRSLIDYLFKALEFTFNKLEERAGKLKEYKFGYIATLHTFGRDMKFNPHLHVIVAEGIVDKNNNYKKYDYFPYEKIRKLFTYELVNLLKKVISPKLKEFSIFANKLTEKKKNGFYVHGPKQQGKSQKDNEELIKYVVRYAGHPAISESRILKVDYYLHLITYFYDPHEDDNLEDDEEKIGRQYVTEDIDEFIKKIIVHIPENGKHNIRYYGFYANKSKKLNFLKQKIHSMLSNKKVKLLLDLLKWRKRIINSYDYDILMCEKCGEILTLVPNMCYIPPSFEYIRRPSYG